MAWLNLFIQFNGEKAWGLQETVSDMGWLKGQRVGLGLFEERYT